MPASMWRWSYSAVVGTKPIGRSTGSADGASDGSEDAEHESHLRIFSTPSWSSEASWCATPLGSMICGPPSWSCETYTSLPRSLLSAPGISRSIGLSIRVSICISIEYWYQYLYQYWY